MPPDAVGDFERICLESDASGRGGRLSSCADDDFGTAGGCRSDCAARMYTIMTEAGERKKLRIEPAHVPPVAASVAVATLGSRCV
jgi:hypothetical protein